MADYKLGEVESRFADIIWNNEPLTSRRLSELAEAELNWKRTTTYTVLKKLCEKGFFQMHDRMVTSLVSKLEYHSIQSEKFVEETFSGSLPALLVAFGSRKKLTEKEIDELQKVIDSMRG